MATPKSVWGIDIGQVALKAIKLRNVEGDLQVEAFDVIEHASILSQPDVDRKQLIRNSLEQFLARNTLADSLLAISVPGQSSFTRFVKLPPVDAKKIPDIVRYEAEQQIPFPINDVVWRWQTFTESDSPDMEVGIFAMKRVDIDDMLDRYTEMEVGVDFVQMAPLALYNFMNFDEQTAEGGATLLADIGADKTDLVVSDGSRIWTRTIQMGGSAFTEALVRSFKLSFSKAEKLKRSAATSKYARQIFQAMRPVFADLVQEIQRSIGYYTALHRDTRFKRLLGLGNGFRLPGLQKYLEQNLNIPVLRIDTYNKLTPSASVNAPAFTENVLGLPVAYGLAVQGLDMSMVTTNLLPGEIATQRSWARKRPWFVGAAAALAVALAMPLYSNHSDKAALEAGQAKYNEANTIAQACQRNRSQYQSFVGQIDQQRQDIGKQFDLFKYRDLWPKIQTMVLGSITDSAVAPDLGKYIRYSQASTEQERTKALAEITAIPRAERKVFFVESLACDFYLDVTQVKAMIPLPGTPGAMPMMPIAGAPAAAAVPAGPALKGYRIVLSGRTPLPQSVANERLYQSVRMISQTYAKQSGEFKILDYAVLKLEKRGALLPGGGVPAPMAMLPPGAAPGTVVPVGPRIPDPLIPAEDMFDDIQFTISWVIALAEPQPESPVDAPKN